MTIVPKVEKKSVLSKSYEKEGYFERHTQKSLQVTYFWSFKAYIRPQVNLNVFRMFQNK